MARPGSERIDLATAVAALLALDLDAPAGVDAAFEVTSAVARETAGVSDIEVDAVSAAFDPHTPGDWSRRPTVRAAIEATSGLTAARALVAELAARSPVTAWDAFVALMRIAHATAAADPLPSRREADRIEAIRRELSGVLTVAGIDVAAGRPQVAAATATAGATGESGVDPADDEPRPIDDERFEAALAELDGLVGLVEVKAEIRRLADRAYIDRLRGERGLKAAASSRHLVFVGNPGTGKTTVARIVAEVYGALGVVPRGHLVEVGRADLVAGFIGQTAKKTRDLFATAVGGMLFVDEAYSLVRGDERDFGTEALDTLVAEMENHRRSTAVVVAGYPREMREFLDANPGLASRFPKTIEFADYSTAELVAIARLRSGGDDYDLGDGAADALTAWLDEVPRGRGFGNGRLVRNALDAVYDRQAQRLVDAGARRDPGAHDAEALRRIEAADVDVAVLDPLLDALR
ncbi:MAG: AAA family ATPase [Actinomycetota bacterium]